MFFGSRVNMKSVTACELAAAGAWRIFDQGDRVGAIVFDDDGTTDVRPHRSQRRVLQILHALVEKNRALTADADRARNPAMLNRVLSRVAASVTHDHLVAIISDFDGTDDTTRRIVSQLAQHNDVLAIPVFDPLSTGSWAPVCNGSSVVKAERATSRMMEISGVKL